MLGVGHFVALRFLFWDEELSPEAEETAIQYAQKGASRHPVTDLRPH
jgi:hypothetical protein